MCRMMEEMRDETMIEQVIKDAKKLIEKLKISS